MAASSGGQLVVSWASNSAAVIGGDTFNSISTELLLTMVRKRLSIGGMATRSPAIAYLRVSGRGQIDGDGFDRQRDAIRRFAKTNAFDLVEEFRDEGVSGTRDLENRPGLAALLDRVESNGVKVVIVERADRLARDLMVAEVIVDELTKAGARVLTADGADLTTADNDPTRTLIRQVLGAVAQFEKSVIVLKLRAARERKRRRDGRCEGRKPFGARAGEAATLARIHELRRKPKGRPRLSIAVIAGMLNAEGRLTRTGKLWAPGTVDGILRRESR
jgi:DNA invertase Pin-like site-specific DNA recombinase